MIIFEKRTYDRVWWATALLAAIAVFEADAENAFHPFAPVFLAIALVVAAVLSFAVNRGHTKVGSLHESSDLPSVFEAVAAEKEVGNQNSSLPVLVNQLSEQSPLDLTKWSLRIAYKHIGVEKLMPSSMAPASDQKESVEVWLKGRQSETSKGRRNVLKEAAELAQLLRGPEYAIHVSPDNEIAICKGDASRSWEMIGREIGVIPQLDALDSKSQYSN